VAERPPLAGSETSVLRPSSFSAHHHDRARSMRNAVQGYGPEQHLDESAQSSVPDDEKVCAFGGLDEDASRRAFEGRSLDFDRRMIAQDLLHDPFERPTNEFQGFGARRVVGDPQVGIGIVPGHYDLQVGTGLFRLSRRPSQSVPRRVRSVHTHDDSPHGPQRRVLSVEVTGYKVPASMGSTALPQVPGQNASTGR